MPLLFLTPVKYSHQRFGRILLPNSYIVFFELAKLLPPMANS